MLLPEGPQEEGPCLAGLKVSAKDVHAESLFHPLVLRLCQLSERGHFAQNPSGRVNE
jgi:hypothetical protein